MFAWRSDLRRGCYWGSQEFAGRLLALTGPPPSTSKGRPAGRTAEQRTHGEREAHRPLREGLIRTGLRAEDLASTPGSEPGKVALALKIWQNTTVNHQWLAENLFMRSAANAGQQLHRARLAHSCHRQAHEGRSHE